MSNVSRSEAVIQFSGSHMSASTTEETLEIDRETSELCQTLGLSADLNLDYLPEVENFDVQLKKDTQGLGITIAGYVCERGIHNFLTLKLGIDVLSPFFLLKIPSAIRLIQRNCPASLSRVSIRAALPMCLAGFRSTIRSLRWTANL